MFKKIKASCVHIWNYHRCCWCRYTLVHGQSINSCSWYNYSFIVYPSVHTHEAFECAKYLGWLDCWWYVKLKTNLFSDSNHLIV